MAALRDNLNLFARQFSLALHHSTRVRLGGSLAPPVDADAEALRASDAHLPGAGWVVGLAACLSFALAAVLLRGSPWGPAVAAVACILATVLVTGGRYESALFRAAERLDPRGGGNGFGAIALVLALAGKITLLAALASFSEASVVVALFAGHVVSRLAAVAAGQWLRGHDGRALRVGTLWCVIPLLLMVPAAGVASTLLALIVAAPACYLMLRLAKDRLAGHPEEGVGATQQACELAFYLGAAIGA